MKSMTVEEFLTDLSARISASGKDLEQLAEGSMSRPTNLTVGGSADRASSSLPDHPRTAVHAVIRPSTPCSVSS